MNPDRKTMIISVSALVIAVITISVAYATLSTTLKVRVGKVTQSSFNWDIKLNSGTVTGIASGTTTTTCGNATVTESSVSVDEIALSKPGDKCSYKLTVQNKGDVDANLASIAATSPDNIACDSTQEGKLVCGNVVYALAKESSGAEILKRGEQKIFKTNGTADFYLVVSYDASKNVSNENIIHTGAGFTVVYNRD